MKVKICANKNIYDAQSCIDAKADIIALEEEIIQPNTEHRYYHPMIDYRQFTFSASKVESMLHKVVENGNRITPKIKTGEILRKAHSTMQKQLESFDSSYKRILNPHIYKVSLTEKLKELKMDFINKCIK